MDNDTAWCPACDRQIRPKRYQVPVQTTAPPAPPPPPPSSSPVRRTKTSGTVRARGGLVQGTGRVKPNGTIRRSDPKPAPAPQPAPAPVKMRTVIDQGPTPLYCSDQCQMADLNRGLPHNFDPARQRTAASVSYTADTDSTVSSSLESESSVESANHGYSSPSLAHLAKIYNFPPPPPPAPVADEVVPQPYPTEYSSGVMMAARRIKEELCGPPQQRNAYGHIITPERKPIPGWTDGSNAWRASIYSCAAPNTTTPVPHKSFATRSPRSSSTPHVSTSLPTESDAELLNRFSQSFRRTSSHISSSVPRRSSSPSSVPTSPPKRERSLLQRGAEGKLLVPQVMLRVNSSASSASLSSQWSAPSARSPLSQASSSGDEDDSDSATQRCNSAASLPRKSKRPSVETRSWSYDNVKTYPIMPIPVKTRIEKRKEICVVDGEEIEVEVEVEVEEKLKRLFLFSAPLSPIPPS